MIRGQLRVGLASKLRLEVPASLRDKLPGPLSGTVSKESDGTVQVEFFTDPTSPHDWGTLDPKWNTYAVQIPAEKVEYSSPEAAELRFTFTKPVDRAWGVGTAKFVMPAGMDPPRKYTPKIKQPAVAEIKAYMAEQNYNPPEPVWNPNQPSPDEDYSELTTQPGLVSGWWRPGLEEHDVSVLVAELNRRLATEDSLAARIENRRVVVTAVIG